jgi:diadenosine tetraphosphatase ApaH/serine/threonine PP2A family protein phosphatase
VRRTIIIGDVHGCLDELKDLLAEVSASAEDRLICAGDLIGKGPDPRGVLEWAMREKNLQCIQGNHEIRLLSYWKRSAAPDKKPFDLETFRRLGRGFDRYMRFVEGWPLYVEDKDFIVVHAGFDPRRGPLGRQSAWELVNIRQIEGTATPWYELYHQRKLVVFGHWSRPEPLVRENTIGIDTGCVHGGFLSALILPGRRIVSVAARKVYRRKESWN